MRHHEAQSASSSKLASSLKPAGHRGGLSKAKLKVDGHVAARTKTHDVKWETKTRDRNHFNAAAGTPFTVCALSQKSGFVAHPLT